MTAAKQLLLAAALEGEICVGGSKSRGRLLLTGESHFCRCYKQIFLLTLAGESSNCLQLLIGVSSNKK